METMSLILERSSEEFKKELKCGDLFLRWTSKVHRNHISEDTSEHFRKIGTMSVNTDREEEYKTQSVIWLH